MQLSYFGQKVTGNSGILELMDDLGRALAGGTQVAMFGGGNPAAIPAVQRRIAEHTARLLKHPQDFDAYVGNYDPPQGNSRFIQAIVQQLNSSLGWQLTPDNIAVTPGSQAGFFMLFNMLAGDSRQGKRKILFPLVPEYIGYADQGIQSDIFTAQLPDIELIGEHRFKYRVGFKHLTIGPEIAAICLSRPTNPTGNAVTDDELAHLSRLAQEHDIPLIIDNAYGLPFPGVITNSVMPPAWHENLICTFSLSKVGLPSSRVGIVVARPEIAKALGSMNAILNLSSPTFGQALGLSLLQDGSLMRACTDFIQPYYKQAVRYATDVLEQKLTGLPYRIHQYEGAYFLWLWLPGLPITSKQLYDRLKKRGVIVVPGEYFFPGLEAPEWRHRYECVRINFARPKEEVDAGFAILAEELGKVL